SLEVVRMYVFFDASSWTVEVPSSVSGLQGSCIMIPCSFNYPEPDEKPSKLTGIWFKDTHDTIYHPDSSSIIKDYRGRTELVGDLRQKNCSLRIDPLHRSDKGPFTFRIEMEDHDKYSYIHDTVSIAVNSPDPPSLSVREEVKVGEEVSISCSVSHSCPSDSPLLTWSHSGTSSVQSQQLTNGQWKVTSSLTFTPSSTDHNQSLVCTAEYRGGKTVKMSKTLNVKCKWTTLVLGSACTSDISMVTCLCIVDSEPPSTVEWSLPDGPLPTLPSTRVERHGSVTMVTLQRALGFSETVHCHAHNTQGNATLSFTLSTNGKVNSGGSVS
uniref:Ig-like domain-containing protein n=1 Tax=Hucho hucho TaxID=62062 RepID=A0A4W5MC55_9TELE